MRKKIRSNILLLLSLTMMSTISVNAVDTPKTFVIQGILKPAKPVNYILNFTGKPSSIVVEDRVAHFSGAQFIYTLNGSDYSLTIEPANLLGSFSRWETSAVHGVRQWLDIPGFAQPESVYVNISLFKDVQGEWTVRFSLADTSFDLVVIDPMAQKVLSLEKLSLGKPGDRVSQIGSPLQIKFDLSKTIAESTESRIYIAPRPLNGLPDELLITIEPATLKRAQSKKGGGTIDRFTGDVPIRVNQVSVIGKFYAEHIDGDYPHGRITFSIPKGGSEFTPNFPSAGFRNPVILEFSSSEAQK